MTAATLLKPSLAKTDSSCPRLARASTSYLWIRTEDVDGRDKPGHDAVRASMNNARASLRNLRRSGVRTALLPQAGVDLFQRRRTRTQLLLGERVERRVDRVEMLVQVFRLAIDIEQSGHHLAHRRMPLQEIHCAKAVVRVVIGGDLLEHQP